MSSLFRKQALEAQKQKLHGDVSLAQPLSIYNSAFIIFVVVTAIAVFLSCSHYARKETVRGYLVPNKGLIKTFANRSGNVEKLHVSEEALVQEGEPLVTIVLRRSMTSGEELSESLIGELKQQLYLLEAERVVNQRMLGDESARLRTAISDNQSSLSVINNLEKLLSEKLSIQLSQQNQHKKLYQDGFLSELDYQSQQEKLINIRQEIENIKSNKVTVSSQLNASQAELKLLPHQYALKESELKRRRSDLQRQIDETENNYRYVIRAAEAGTVAAIQIVEGEFIATNRPLMSLIPQGAELVAELLLPTRSAGFVREGDEARLRFDAFPYQRFGFLESHISRIDKALLFDGEARVPVNLSEPVYRIRTQLAKQDMLAYGDDPIYSLKGRVG